MPRDKSQGRVKNVKGSESGPKTQPKADARKEAQADALRENLLKRKAQLRKRTQQKDTLEKS